MVDPYDKAPLMRLGSIQLSKVSDYLIYAFSLLVKDLLYIDNHFEASLDNLRGLVEEYKLTFMVIVIIDGILE